MKQEQREIEKKSSCERFAKSNYWCTIYVLRVILHQDMILVVFSFVYGYRVRANIK